MKGERRYVRLDLEKTRGEGTEPRPAASEADALPPGPKAVNWAERRLGTG